MTAIIIYGPKASGKTFNAQAFAHHYKKDIILDTGAYGKKLPKSIAPNTLALTTCLPRAGEPRTWIHVDDAMRAIGKDPFRLVSGSQNDK